MFQDDVYMLLISFDYHRPFQKSLKLLLINQFLIALKIMFSTLNTDNKKCNLGFEGEAKR